MSAYQESFAGLVVAGAVLWLVGSLLAVLTMDTSDLWTGLGLVASKIGGMLFAGGTILIVMAAFGVSVSIRG